MDRPDAHDALPRRQVHGLFAALDPQWLFRFSGMRELNHPEVYQCLGMVVGLSGIVYAETRRPEHGFLPAAVGLLGKGPGPDRDAAALVDRGLARDRRGLVPHQRRRVVGAVRALPAGRVAALAWDVGREGVVTQAGTTS
jgi:hypothetical protein